MNELWWDCWSGFTPNWLKRRGEVKMEDLTSKVEIIIAWGRNETNWRNGGSPNTYLTLNFSLGLSNHYNYVGQEGRDTGEGGDLPSLENCQMDFHHPFNEGDYGKILFTLKVIVNRETIPKRLTINAGVNFNQFVLTHVLSQIDVSRWNQPVTLEFSNGIL